MIYLYLFGTCFHFIYVFMIITKETLKWQVSVSVGNKGLFNGANSIHM